ncbi:diaminopimelate epimerase [Cyclobacterium jeungdonense]|uniref:Diaminopimelate epimerase n=1 Tax=Cyclobacterium jeungdonense TaxID=708087 RepID=A0ABT8C6A2_9BACT|nr:diaminopimelate epimerase [Cyclobacterium jeungdonense]MDN3687622.1 diaminopimelate epimerase [Cyclobacterium jeungdonense]
MTITFYKYQGTGNDFIMVDGREHSLGKDPIPTIKNLCHRKFGIGADGLILLKEKTGFDFEMVYYNADGSQSMCGNGARCAVAFANYLGIIGNSTDFLAIDGSHQAEIKGDWVALEMGTVKKIHSAGEDYFVDTGSPHHVRVVDELATYDVVGTGRSIRNDKVNYPKGTNVNFLKPLNKNHIEVRTFERGVEDETLSCGTGVTACALVYGSQQGQNEIKISTPGGNLEVSFVVHPSGSFENIILAGPAKQVFSGKISLAEIA